jgi:hypothetical protein
MRREVVVRRLGVPYVRGAVAVVTDRAGIRSSDVPPFKLDQHLLAEIAERVVIQGRDVGTPPLSRAGMPSTS